MRAGTALASVCLVAMGASASADPPRRVRRVDLKTNECNIPYSADFTVPENLATNIALQVRREECEFISTLAGEVASEQAKVLQSLWRARAAYYNEEYFDELYQQLTRSIAALRDAASRSASDSHGSKRVDENAQEGSQCKGGELIRFVMEIQAGLVPSKSKGCNFRIAGIAVLSSTSDGWLIVGAPPKPMAAFRASEPLMNGALIRDRRARFIGMQRFTTVEGTVSVLPAFKLLDD